MKSAKERIGGPKRKEVFANRSLAPFKEVIDIFPVKTGDIPVSVGLMDYPGQPAMQFLDFNHF
jgi:hypothetical protein